MSVCVVLTKKFQSMLFLCGSKRVKRNAISTELRLKLNMPWRGPTFMIVDVTGSVVAELHAASVGASVMQHHGRQRGEVAPVVDCPESRMVRSKHLLPWFSVSQLILLPQKVDMFSQRIKVQCILTNDKWNTNLIGTEMTQPTQAWHRKLQFVYNKFWFVWSLKCKA